MMFHLLNERFRGNSLKPRLARRRRGRSSSTPTGICEPTRRSLTAEIRRSIIISGAGVGERVLPVLQHNLGILEHNPDVADEGADPLQHYWEHGWKEGRNPGPKFTVNTYLDRYSDVRDAGLEPLGHYIRHGRSEGRSIGILRRVDRRLRYARRQ